MNVLSYFQLVIGLDTNICRLFGQLGLQSPENALKCSIVFEKKVSLGYISLFFTFKIITLKWECHNFRKVGT